MNEENDQQTTKLKLATRTLGELAEHAGVPFAKLLEAAKDVEADFWKKRQKEDTVQPDDALIYFAWPPSRCDVYTCFIGTVRVGSTPRERRDQLRNKRGNLMDALASMNIEVAADRPVVLNLSKGLSYKMLADYHASQQQITMRDFEYALDISISTNSVVGANALNEQCAEYEGNWEFRIYDKSEKHRTILVTKVEDLVLLPELVGPLLRKVGSFDVSNHSQELQIVYRTFEALWLNPKDGRWKSWNSNLVAEIQGYEFFKDSENMTDFVRWVFSDQHDFVRFAIASERADEEFEKRVKKIPDRLIELIRVSEKFWGQWGDGQSRPSQREVAQEFVRRKFSGKWADAAAKLVAKVRKTQPPYKSSDKSLPVETRADSGEALG